MRRAWAAAFLALAACTPATRTAAPPPPAAQAIPAEVAPAPAPPPPVAEAAPSKAPPLPDSVPAAPPKEPAKEAPKAAAKPAPPKAPAAAPAKGSEPAKSPAAPRVATLDLKSLEQRLRDTGAIGVMTKLSLKNQVDDLLDKFRDYHRGALKVPLAELRRPYEMLLMKVLTLLQDGDPALAQSINASREAIWSVLTDREKFAQFT